MTNQNFIALRDGCLTVIGLTVFTFVTISLSVCLSGDRIRNQSINPEVALTLRGIENRCLNESWPHETVRCKEALEFAYRCYKSEFCNLEEMYCTYDALGFNLPPYYRADSEFAKDYPC